VSAAVGPRTPHADTDDELPQFRVTAVIEPPLLQVSSIWSVRTARTTAPAGDVADGVPEKGLGDADGTDDGDVRVRVGESGACRRRPPGF
jgi:hypothetical protein